MITRKLLKIAGVEKYINSSTGEVVEMKVEGFEMRDFNFTKIWLKPFLKILCDDEITMSSTRIKFFAWLIERMNRENEISMTVKGMAEASGISYQVAVDVLKALKRLDFIKKVQTVYIINPDIIFKGSVKMRQEVMKKYNSKNSMHS